MAMVLCGSRSFPRDLDVQVSVTKVPVETLTDLSVLCAVVTDDIFYPDARRVQYYTTMQDLEEGGMVPATSKAWAMANAFFSQPTRAQTLCIGRMYTAPVAGFIVGSAGGGLVDFKTITNGSFAIKVDGAVSKTISGLDFSAATTFENVATVINTALTTATVGATIAYVSGVWQITSATTGATSKVEPLTEAVPTSGTFIGGKALLALSQDSYANQFDGYVPGDIASEMALIAQAATCSGKPIYAWALDSTLRTLDDQTLASNWVQGQRNWLVLTSNDAEAYNGTSKADIGTVLQTSGNFRTALMWSNQASQYPCVALAAYMLSVNYAERNSTVTAKFKDLTGISTVGISTSQLTILENKGYNVLTKIGNDARTVREGDEVLPTWFIDDLINLDNLATQIQTAVYNVFLRSKKVPYTNGGALMIRQAIAQICDLFVLNGALASRQRADDTVVEGYVLDPPYTIDYTAMHLIPVAQRAQRVGPPFTVNVNLAGAIHTVAINVNAYS